MYSHNPVYLSRISDTVTHVKGKLKRISFFRVDLRFPLNSTPYRNDSKVITRFIESLKSKIKYDIKRKSQLWGRTLVDDLDYIWVREVGDINNNTHYHVALLLNKDIYYSFGDFNEVGNLANLISQAWCSALNIQPHSGLVNFAWRDHLDQNKVDSDIKLSSIMQNLSYLAKDHTKRYHDGYRSFGCSTK
ncbi:inovirus Gp2 family protein [Providencia rustigianii]|uniref:inovirus Gp2 family protein n=1 Tax=Providencia rustigianii TaxID=158850 RepID=UPI000F6CC002|nr:inovirus Gp2 family protein [Providencia rustigianii]MTC61484.1 inovirus Gp2 family protein [Providencia rustigianii]VEH56729.1 Protein of uncharacterised function (DUF3296) [Providencia rustigianii]